MDRKGIIRGILWIVGSVLVGALGSGVWVNILGPGLSWTRDLLLNVASIWVDSWKDGIYREVAEGFRETASVQAHARLTVLMTMLVSGLVVFVWAFEKQVRGKWEELVSRFAGSKESASDGVASKEDLQRHLLALKPELGRVRRGNYISVVLVAVWVGLLIMSSVRITYVTSAVAHYEQAMRIAGPYLSSTEEKEIASAFAQVSSKAEYVAVVSKVEKVALARGQRVPEFSVW